MNPSRCTTPHCVLETHVWNVFTFIELSGQLIRGADKSSIWNPDVFASWWWGEEKVVVWIGSYSRGCSLVQEKILSSLKAVGFSYKYILYDEFEAIPWAGRDPDPRIRDQFIIVQDTLGRLNRDNVDVQYERMRERLLRNVRIARHRAGD